MSADEKGHTPKLPTPENIASALSDRVFAGRKGHGGADVSYIQISKASFENFILEAIKMHVDLNTRAALSERA